MRRVRPLFLASGLLWGAWIAASIVPEWTGCGSNPATAELRVLDRQTFEAGYGAGWLTQYLAAHESWPEVVPPNPAAAGNRRVLDLCPASLEQMLQTNADWAYCSQDGKVRALARADRLLIPDGGWNTPLDFTHGDSP